MKHAYKTVSTMLARRYLAASGEIGLSPQEVMRAAGLASADVSPHGGRLATHRFLRLSHLYPSLPYQRAFLSDGLRRLAEDFPTLAAVCTNAPTLAAAVTAYLRFRPVIAEVERAEWVISSDAISVRFPDGMTGLRGKGAIAHFADLAALAYHYGGEDGWDVQCSLAGPAPVEPASVDRYLQCRVAYQRPETVIRFSGEAIQRAYQRFDATAHAVMLDRLREELRAVHTSESFVAVVQATLRNLLLDGAGLSDLELQRETCARLHMTRSTLWRRLKEEGATYTVVLAQVREEMACQLLRAQTLSLAQISDQLGFAAPSAFSRFFKQRSGWSPREFRAQQGRQWAGAEGLARRLGAAG